MTRGEKAQELARSLGATFVGGAADMPPEPLDAADHALADLKAGRFDGAAVLVP
jgi:hypothetical protein